MIGMVDRHRCFVLLQGAAEVGPSTSDRNAPLSGGGGRGGVDSAGPFRTLEQGGAAYARERSGGGPNGIPSQQAVSGDLHSRRSARAAAAEEEDKV